MPWLCIFSRPCETHYACTLPSLCSGAPSHLLTVHHIFNATYVVFSLTLTYHNAGIAKIRIINCDVAIGVDLVGSKKRFIHYGYRK